MKRTIKAIAGVVLCSVFALALLYTALCISAHYDRYPCGSESSAENLASSLAERVMCWLLAPDIYQQMGQTQRLLHISSGALIRGWILLRSVINGCILYGFYRLLRFCIGRKRQAANTPL